MALKKLIYSVVILCFFTLSISASVAKADSVFLLQLGSFPSEEQANQRWSDLNSKHANVLSGLSLRIAQVALPPDNTIIYRTQAGPIESREEATKVCQSLAGTKDECFVVETAMFVGDTNTAAIVPSKKAPEQSPLEVKPAEVAELPLPQNLADVQPKNVPETIPDQSALKTAAETAAESAPITLPSLPIPPASTSATASPAVPVIEEAPKENADINPSIARPTPYAFQLEQNATARTTDPKELVDTPVNVVDESLATPVKPEIIKPDVIKPTVASVKPKPILRAPSPALKPRYKSLNLAHSEDAEVKVAEAIRVPLSSGQNEQTLPAARIETRPLGMAGFPSQNVYAKTLWAQLNYFSDQQAALAFWDEFRFANKEITRGIRVRVTQPYYFSRSGRVSLRVGPFSSMDGINSICASASSKSINCSLVKDLGSSVAANSPRDRQTFRGYDERSRMRSWNIAPDAPANWVQLGSYPSPDQAWSAWDRIKTEQADIIGKLGADVNTANLSSASTQVMRLRAGPFMTKTAAMQLCDRLESRGVSCIVVSNR